MDRASNIHHKELAQIQMHREASRLPYLLHIQRHQHRVTSPEHGQHLTERLQRQPSLYQL